MGGAGFPGGPPGPPNRLQEMEFLKRKVDAGADYICTQLFFDNRDFYDFRERCVLAGIRVPILAGIMPIVSKAGMVRMAELALGARFPAALLRGIGRGSDDPLRARLGLWLGLSIFLAGVITRQILLRPRDVPRSAAPSPARSRWLVIGTRSSGS